VRDRRALHGHDLTYQSSEVGERPAELAAERVEHRVRLLLSRPVVDEHELSPVALEDVARDVHRADQGQTAHVDSTDRALVEVVGDDRVAGSPVGVLPDPAWAQHVARADLEQRAFQLIARGPRRGLFPRGRHVVTPPSVIVGQ